jgi:peptidoglycan/LPS O-acetylase OafA/YrhL
VRIKRLDVLRSVAVILVLVLHGQILDVFNKVGWAGVDLFFVLSGFLISGLFYSEYKKNGSIDAPRFFVRRGLKIYPAFLVMILVTFVARRILGQPNSLGSYLHEVLFVQNYKIGIWQHTWSLGVEEHFYIFLPILLLVMIRLSDNRSDPFRRIPLVFGLIATSCILLRAATIYLTNPNTFGSSMVTNPTHERVDSLFFGVFLGYLYHYYPDALQDRMKSPYVRVLMGLITVMLLSCCFIFTRENHFLLIFGLSFLYLGFGGLIMLSLQIRNVLPQPLAQPIGALGTACAFIGTYSYSIYLWHIPFQAFAPGVVRRLFRIQLNSAAAFWFYFVGSVIFGILMARLIEFPVLKLRDKLFPSPKDAGRTSVIGTVEPGTPNAAGDGYPAERSLR